MEAVRFLYLRYKDNVYGYVLSIVREPHEAEDATQQVFMKLISAIGKYEPRSVPFTAWILRVARNIAIDHLRQRRAVPCEEVFEPARQTDESSRECRWGLEVALDTLPEDQRDVVMLRHLVGLTPGEIADADGPDRVLDPRPAPSRTAGAPARAGRHGLRADRARRLLRGRAPSARGRRPGSTLALGVACRSPCSTPRRRCSALREQFAGPDRRGRRARDVHPRPRARGIRARVRRLHRGTPRDRGGQRHRRDHDRSACAGRRARRRGGGSVVHVLRVGRGDRQRRRPSGVLRRRSGHAQRHAGHGARGADPADHGHRDGRPVRLPGAAPRRSAHSACRCWRTPRRPRARASTAAAPDRSATSATFSFYPSKNLGCFGDGGAITTDDDQRRRSWRARSASTARATSRRSSGRLQLAPGRAPGGHPARGATRAGRLVRRAAARPRRLRELQARASTSRPPCEPAGADAAWHLYVAPTHARTS